MYYSSIATNFCDFILIAVHFTVFPFFSILHGITSAFDDFVFSWIAVVYCKQKAQACTLKKRNERKQKPKKIIFMYNMDM